MNNVLFFFACFQKGMEIYFSSEVYTEKGVRMQVQVLKYNQHKGSYLMHAVNYA